MRLRAEFSGAGPASGNRESCQSPRFGLNIQAARTDVCACRARRRRCIRRSRSLRLEFLWRSPCPGKSVSFPLASLLLNFKIGHAQFVKNIVKELGFLARQVATGLLLQHLEEINRPAAVGKVWGNILAARPGQQSELKHRGGTQVGYEHGKSF